MIPLKEMILYERGETAAEYFFWRKDPKDRLRPWTRTDIEKFQKDDPQHGNNVKALRNAGILTAVGSLGGGVAGGAFTFSRGGTLNGSIFTGLIGGVSSLVAATFVSQQVATLAFGLYKFDKQETSQAFRSWWRNNGGAM